MVAKIDHLLALRTLKDIELRIFSTLVLGYATSLKGDPSPICETISPFSQLWSFLNFKCSFIQGGIRFCHL
ncbi:DEHA2A00176p [Debaryomyces hansenii CBS767]|uniref:DEHA2A00176p n=1 Tax=Debaryomyces hansenii (strain ATCC 36239 / CBS 767 / BCRC 21394 / JCM 1990 / NBRC 0083 / IGC 2968) TaxID=284592 RepID=Q6BZN6_DEBHA|nr:DEHA2A00176p [Debaryomyces hansenii CBS767]CAG84275.1 DEHA2A00176p [Debaryomyces hansenii CBS767]|eukprot:XP_456333.1 DEHA2A00176p [Debaryomyces hansenii CBS767]